MIPSSIIQVITLFWEWVKQDANNWVSAMTSPAKFLETLDIDKEEALNVALRLSAFSIILGILCQVPAQLAFVPKQLSTNQILSGIVLEYIEIFVAALSLKLSVAIFRGTATFRRCAILSLVMSVYLLPKYLVSLPLLAQPTKLKQYQFGTGSLEAFTDPSLAFAWIANIALLTFIEWQYMRATQGLANVGWIRALLITCAAVFMFAIIIWQAIRPIAEALLIQVLS